MHLLVRETRSLDEAAPAVDLGHAPADLLVLSFSDADLAALGAADRGTPSLRLAPLGKLRHPLSVDLYLEQTAAHARCIVLRLLGGLDYWRYGAEELAALCRDRAIPLAILPGDGRDDPALSALSTVDPHHYARLDACFRHGGRQNMARVLRSMGFLAGLAPEAPEPAQPMPQHGVHSLDLAPGPLAAIVFYRSHLLSEDYAPITALEAALRSRGFGVGAIYAGSLKAPETASYVARTLAAWCPDVVLNATGFSSRLPTGTGADEASPLDAADTAVLQLVLAGTNQEAWLASSRGPGPRPTSRCRSCCRSWTAGCSPPPSPARRPAATARCTSRTRTASPWPPTAPQVGPGYAPPPAAERRVAIVLSDYPVAGGQRGHAVGLDGFASLASVTALLAEAGYSTTPIAAEAAVQALCHAAPRPFLSLADYQADPAGHRCLG